MSRLRLLAFSSIIEVNKPKEKFSDFLPSRLRRQVIQVQSRAESVNKDVKKVHPVKPRDDLVVGISGCGVFFERQHFDCVFDVEKGVLVSESAAVVELTDGIVVNRESLQELR